MRTTTTTKSKTAVYAKRTSTPVQSAKTDKIPANCITVKQFMKELREEIEKRYV